MRTTLKVAVLVFLGCIIPLMIVGLNIASVSDQIAGHLKNSSLSNSAHMANWNKEIGAGQIEIRGQIATGNFEWNPQSFAGFYYDLKGDIGTETLSTVLTGMKLSGDPPCGVRYETHSKPKEFEFKDWGAFNLIGFLAEGYFAGYIENTKDAEKNLFFRQSSDNNVLSHSRLLKVLIDDDTERTVVSNSPLKLAEGYELNITSIDLDGKEVNIELSKDGSVVDKKVVSPSKDGATMADRTYFYKNPAVGDLGSLITIAVHFKNAFRGYDSNLATLDGLWQVSDEAMDIMEETQYGDMTVTSVDQVAGAITMENLDNPITLLKNKDIFLMDGFMIKTADNDTLRYCICREIVNPGSYEIRGAVATADSLWTVQNFSGFYYDIDDDIGTETLSTTLSEKKMRGDFPYGIKYVTTAKPKDFEFKDWGAFKIMGFLGKRYFAGYIGNAENASKNVLFGKSAGGKSQPLHQLQKILIDDDTEKTVTSFTPLKLEEGYELAIKSIDIDGNKVYLELSKDGAVVDSKVISPSKDNPTMADKTYYYKKDVGDTNDMVVIAAHFKNAFRGSDTNLATVDGIWQLSDVPIDVEVNTEYDKMRIASVSADTITMDNKDNTITLSKNNDIDLMGDINIKTSDQDVIDNANPQRYYIYKEATIEGAVASVVEAEPAVEAAPAAEEAPAVEENRTAEAPVAEAAAPANMSANYAYEAKKGDNLASFETTIYAIIAVLFLFGFTILLSLAELWAIKKIGFDVAANLSIKGEYGKSGIQFDAVGVMAFLIFQPLMIFYLVKEVAAMLVS